MAVLPDYVTGTITLANGSTTVTGTGTMFATAAFRAGDTLQIQNLTAIIASVDSNTSLTLTEPWTGTSLTNAPYRARYLPDGVRVTAQTTTLIELLGNGVLSNIAGIPVEDGNLLIGNTAGQYETISKDELGVQDPNGSLGKLAALTLEANKAITTDGSGNAQQSDIGTLGRALLALATGNSSQYVRADGTLQTLNKAAVGLGNVDNTSDASKPISTATQTALNAKANSSYPTLSGVVTISVPSSEWMAVNASNPRQNTAAGTFNHAPVLLSRVGTGQLFASFKGMEAVGVNMQAVIDVVSGSTGASFSFTHIGNANVPGAFTAGSKSFLLDHPNDPYNKDLVFMSTEAPKAGVEFWGTVRLVDGVAEVDLDSASNLSPGTFVALTQNAIPLKPNNLDGETEVRAGRVVDGKFSIFAVNNPACNDEVSWHVKAERADPFIKTHEFCDPVTGLLIPEHEKEDA